MRLAAVDRVRRSRLSEIVVFTVLMLICLVPAARVLAASDSSPSPDSNVILRIGWTVLPPGFVPPAA